MGLLRAAATTANRAPLFRGVTSERPTGDHGGISASRMAGILVFATALSSIPDSHGMLP